MKEERRRGGDVLFEVGKENKKARDVVHLCARA